MFTVLPETYTGDMLEKYRDTAKLRYNLIHEEVTELREAIAARDFIEVIDALTDILYVVYGAGATFGIDLDTGFRNYILNKGLVIPDKLNGVADNATHFTLVSSMNVSDFKIKSNSVLASSACSAPPDAVATATGAAAETPNFSSISLISSDISIMFDFSKYESTSAREIAISHSPYLFN